jgi:hypothetical protein
MPCRRGTNPLIYPFPIPGLDVIFQFLEVDFHPFPEKRQFNIERPAFLKAIKISSYPIKIAVHAVAEIDRLLDPGPWLQCLLKDSEAGE